VKRRFIDLAVAGIVLGTMQAVIETLLVAWLNRDLLLAPYRFFPTHAYDAFAKIYFLCADHLPIPLLLQSFVPQGFASKLALAPELVAINIAVATLVALVLAPLLTLASVGRPAEACHSDRLRRALGLIVVTCLFVHIAVWAAAFQTPESATAFNLLRAVFRDVVQGGAGFAIAVLLMAGVAARAVLARSVTIEATAAAAVVLALFAAGLASRDANARPPVQPPEPPAASPAAGDNVVLISIDSLRADHLGIYGYGRETSPAIDAIGRAGVVFRHSTSTTSWTLPAHMSLLTARSLLGHGVVSDDRSLPESVETVADAFRSGGYETHAIVSAPYLSSRYGFARGFDDYDDRTIHFDTNEESYRSVTAPALIDAADAFLARSHDRPFFLFLHFWDVHYDYAPGAPYDTMFDPDYKGTVTGNNFYFDPAIDKSMNPRDLQHLIALYDGEIRLVDDHIARLRKTIERLGLSGRTIIAVVADHGDEFFEHGNKGHHRTLYEEVLHTPFVLEVPGLRPSAAEVAGEVSIVDVAPTLLGLAGLAQPAGAEGRNFSGLYTGAKLPPEGAVEAELYRTGTRNVQVARIDERKKIIHQFQRRSVETYDLAADPGEHASLAPGSAPAESLMTGLRDWLDQHWHHFDQRARKEGIQPVVLDAKARDQLRSLGYLQ